MIGLNCISSHLSIKPKYITKYIIKTIYSLLLYLSSIKTLAKSIEILLAIKLNAFYTKITFLY